MLERTNAAEAELAAAKETIAGLEGRLKDADADAKRYRAIRNGCGTDLYATLNGDLDGPALDAAIDAAIREPRDG